MTDTYICEEDAAAEEQQRLVDDILANLGQSYTSLKYQFHVSTFRRNLVENLIEEETFSTISGQPKKGKNLAAVNLALQLIKGKSWLGNKIKYSSNVLYMAYEDPEFMKRDFRR